MRHFIRYIYFFIIATLLFSCKDSTSDEQPPVIDAKRTILVYMVASNDLGARGYDSQDLLEMEHAIASNGTNGCRVLVFHVTNSEMPVLFEFKKMNNGKVKRTVLNNYDKSLPATSVERMSGVFDDMVRLAPAKEYGLILWSHASGWAVNLPRQKMMNKAIKREFLVRNYGMDGKHEMKLDELEKALPANLFDFIYADVCYMGSVEVAYQLRNKIKYLIASPTVILGEGMPYHLNLPELCADHPDLVQVCRNTFDYYNSKSGQMKSCTISLTDCTKLEPLATVCNEIFKTTTEINDISAIQNYIVPSDGICIFFDFRQYMAERLKQSPDYNLVSELDRCLSDAVVYKNATNEIFSELKIDKNNYSGLSVYIENTGGNDNDEYYRTTDWYQATRKN